MAGRVVVPGSYDGLAPKRSCEDAVGREAVWERPPDGFFGPLCHMRVELRSGLQAQFSGKGPIAQYAGHGLFDSVSVDVPGV